MPDPRFAALRQLAGRAMDADGDYDDSSGLDSPAEERAEYGRVRIPMHDVRAAVDPRAAALASIAGRPTDPLLNRAAPGYSDIPQLEDMTMLPGGRTASVDDLRAAGMMTSPLARKQWPSVQRAGVMHEGRPHRGDSMILSGASMKSRDPGASTDKYGTVADAGAGATSATRAAYGPPAERELTDAEYDEMQRAANARARIEREQAMAQAAAPRAEPYAYPRGAGASRATSGGAAMTPEELARAESLRRLYEGR